MIQQQATLALLVECSGDEMHSDDREKSFMIGKSERGREERLLIRHGLLQRNRALKSSDRTVCVRFFIQGLCEGVVTNELAAVVNCDKRA